MKLKSRFSLAELGGETMAVPLDETENFRGVLKLNESGAEVFRGLMEGEDTQQLVQRLMKKYEGLDAETAEKAVDTVLQTLKDAGLAED